jgi:hypothetical protein
MSKKQNKLGKGKKPTNLHQKQKYSDRRLFKTEQNRRWRRQCHLTLHPKDIQTLEALKKML